MSRSWFLAVAAAAVLSVSMPHAAHAQVWPLGVRRPNVPSSDLNMASGVAKDLYATPETTAGTSKEWSNPATGNTGIVTLVRDLQLHGLPCRDVRYEFRLTKTRETRTYTLNWCHTPQDTWRIAP